MHDVYFSSEATQRDHKAVPTDLLEQAMAGGSTAHLGNVMDPETFKEPVADQTFRDMMPRIVNMLSSFLKETLSALLGRFFTGFDSDNKAPPVPTYLAEAAAEEAAKVAELTASLADEEAYKAAYDAAIEAGIAAEAGAYAAAVAKAAGFKALVPGKLAAFKALYEIKFLEMEETNGSKKRIIEAIPTLNLICHKPFAYKKQAEVLHGSPAYTYCRIRLFPGRDGRDHQKIPLQSG